MFQLDKPKDGTEQREVLYEERTPMRVDWTATDEITQVTVAEAEEREAEELRRRLGEI